MAFFEGTSFADVFVGGNDDDVVTNIGQGLDIISTGGGNDTVTVIPDAGGLLDLLPDIVAMGTGDDDHLIIDSRTSDRVVNIAPPLLNLADGLFGVLNLNGLERLTFSGVERFTVYGGSADDNISTGNGNDVINGGAGADRMVGGSGDDTYYVDNARDVVLEFAGGGTDHVYSTVSYRLSDTLENLTLQGAANISAHGNRGNNILRGNDGDNFIDGVAGADTMIGGRGNDTYVVNSTTDVVVETASGGIDTVLSSVSHRLGQHVENLTLTGDQHLKGYGNGQANTLRGNDFNNYLDGGGGADTLIGGLGNDTYVVDLSTDVIGEAAGEGIDRVISSVTWTLGENLEYLELRGSGNINAYGNDLANYIWGNAGNNVIYGGGGRDILRGGDGADRFFYSSVNDSRPDAYDVIMDFGNGDVIDLQAIDANTRVSGNQAFSLVAQFTKTAGQMLMRYDAATNQTTLHGDVNGDGVSDFRLRIAGDHRDSDGILF